MRVTVDGNEAAASAAYRLNEVCCIYPITPSSPMAELADEWSSQGRPNVWGSVPAVMEMQSEGGAAGGLPGALQSGALTPDRPVLRGTAQNPDVYFQARETVNPFYAQVPDAVTDAMDAFAAVTGRQYRLAEYTGDPEADRVIVVMGSGGQTAAETAA